MCNKTIHNKHIHLGILLSVLLYLLALFPAWAETRFPIPLAAEQAQGSQAVVLQAAQVISDQFIPVENKPASNAKPHMLATAVTGDTVPGATDDHTAFNVLQREVDLFRLVALSSNSGVALEIPAKSQPIGNPFSQSAFYQEFLFHAGLAGVRTFLFDNSAAQLSDEEVVAQTLQELDQVLTVAPFQSQLDAFVFRDSHYVLSSAQQNGQHIWRFSPLLAAGETVRSITQQQQPASFKVGGQTLTLPATEVLATTEPASTAGVWLVSSANIEPAKSYCPSVGLNQRCIEYYANPHLSGLPRAYVESSLKQAADEAVLIKQNWDVFGTGFATGVDQFAVRIQEKRQFTGGDYRFSLEADDAVRLWIDGELVIDGWSENTQAERTLSADISLAAGEHALRVEYADYAQAAALSLQVAKVNCQGENCADSTTATSAETPSNTDTALTNSSTQRVLENPVTQDEGDSSTLVENEALACTDLPTNTFCAEFFKGTELAGDALHQRVDEAINFAWKANSPEPSSVPKDRFSVRWQGDFTLEAGDYRFIAKTDDGMRVWVNGEEIITSWKPQRATEYFTDISLSAGTHRIKVEYFDNWGWATAQLRWEKLANCEGIPRNQFCGTFFNAKRNLKVEPARTLLTDSLDWQHATVETPLHGLRHYNYSARWLGEFDFPQAGSYQFNMQAADGMRVWIDDVLVSDQWGRAAQDQRIVQLSEGAHIIKVEYHQDWGNARALLTWDYLAECNGEAVVKDAYCMEIYSNRNLAQLQGVNVFPKYLKKVDAIDFDWQKGSPEPLVWRDNFAIRWVGQHEFAKGNYRFTTSTDDGVRLYVDDELVIDRWRGQRETRYEQVLSLEAGYHQIRMEYFEGGGLAAAHLNWEKLASCDEAAVGQVCGVYFNNEELKGDVADVQISDAIDFDWGKSKPTPKVKQDRFSARWITTEEFDTGLYRFSTDVDDGVRIYVDDELILDVWPYKHPLYGKYTVLHPISAGLHTVKVEYHDRGGPARAKVNWEKANDCSVIPENAFCTEFYGTRNFGGEVLNTQLTASLDFDWKGAQPIKGVWKDNFSTRSVGQFEFEAGLYRFAAIADDGLQLWVDGESVIHQQRYNQGKPSTGIVRLSAGMHELRTEHFEGGGLANVQLNWEKLADCAATPAGQLCAEYFDNTELQGEPVAVEFVDAVNFQWGKEAPKAGLKRDKFSVRWSGDVEFADGLYRFRTDAIDDGMRIKVDDEVVLDVWKRQWPWYGDQRALKHMQAGVHKVVVEYREDWGVATARASWEMAPDCGADVPSGEFCMSYYRGTDLDAEQLIDTILVPTIDNQWGTKSPAASVPADRFSVRWVGDFEFAEGEYQFDVLTDDGFRLRVDDQLVIDAWKGQRPTKYQHSMFLPAGKHRIVAEYYDQGGGATAKLSWTAGQLDKPATPDNLQVLTNNQSQVSLTWDAVALIDSYKVYRDGQLLAKVAAGKEFVDETVEVLKEYTYQVVSVWPNGRESNPAEVTLTVADTLPPSQAQSLAVAAATASSLSLTWQAATDNVGIASYEVWRDQVKVADVVETSFTDENLNSFARYTYQLIAVDSSGNHSAASLPLTVFTQDGTAPSVPTGLSANISDGGSITLRWQAATDNIGVGLYKVLRDGEALGTTNGTLYLDTTVAESTEYSYQVIAVDGIGNSSAASEALVVRSGDITAPQAISDLQAQVDGESILLTWSPVTDNTGVTSYRVIRDGRILGLTGLQAYRDMNVETGITYRYSVRAMDASRNIATDSNIQEVTLGEICDSTQQQFKQVEPSLSRCMDCHVAGGSAQNTRLRFQQNGSSAQHLSSISAINQLLGQQAVLDKVSGKSHGGDLVFATTSQEYTQLAKLLGQLTEPDQCDDQDDNSDGEDNNGGEPPKVGWRIPVESLAANCASCHGSEGASSGPATPGLAGLGSDYLLKTMRDYKSGARASTVMQRIAKGYTDEQLQLVASYFAAKPPHVETQVIDNGLVEQGRTLHNKYCASCHTNEGRDLANVGVRLAGQWKPYMQYTLEDYLTERSKAPATMQTRLSNLYQQAGDDGIKALVEFYASAGPDTTAPDAPDFPEVAAVTVDSVTLSWMDTDDDWSVSYYEVYRDGELLGSTQFSVYTDTGLMPGEYAYEIVAVDEVGNRSTPSEPLTVSLSAEDTVSEGLQLLDHDAALRKSALVLLGRLPTEAELASVSSEGSFRQTLRTMLDAEGALDKFVYRAAHETFLSNGAARANSGQGIRKEDFPVLESLSRNEMRVVSDTIRKEPVYLLQHIVDQDKPWTESLTADYTVLNAELAKALQAEPISGSFAEDARLPARITRLSARLEARPFPHAGVLTTNAWLSRFPTTDTNRNRHRSTMVFKQFLGVDLEALAQRPIDDSGNGDFLVPTMENSNCMVCHTVMDPVAGAFRNWGTANRYQQNFNGSRGALDSLARSYKSRNYAKDYDGKAWYHGGDQWYRDMLKPGLGDMEMPGAYGLFATFNAGETPQDKEVVMEGATDSLQWLGRALVQDPRFAKGSVYFWYRALFKREPLTRPLDMEALDYDARLAAFNEQDALFDQMAARLVQDRGYGAWNIKDLLIDMAASPLLRANTKSASLISTSDLGLARLLTPEELNRKLKAVTGRDWWHFQDNRVWSSRMGLFYGGFDGGRLQSNPNSKMNALMSRIPERMATEMSCEIVYQEFRKQAEDRKLFPLVDALHTPAFEQVDIAKNNMLINPGAEDDLSAWIVETGNVRVLSGARGCQGGPSIHNGEKIFNPGSICKYSTELSSIYQQVDVTPWASMIDGGEVQALFGAALRGWSKNNDEASVYLSFHAVDGSELSRSELLSSREGAWKALYDYVQIPVQTRMIRFHIQGKRIYTNHPNNDAFADDAYLRIMLPGTKAQTLGEQQIRANIQYLHQQVLGEKLSIDSAEIDRTYALFHAVWADRSGSTDDNTCRLYREWEDPDRTRLAWSVVMMYLLTDARFLYE